jgi:hypothetical protein
VRGIVCGKFWIFLELRVPVARDRVLACVRVGGRVSFRVMDSFKVTVMVTDCVSGKFRYINGVIGFLVELKLVPVLGWPACRVSFKETIIKNRTMEKFS